MEDEDRLEWGGIGMRQETPLEPLPYSRWEVMRASSFTAERGER